jgi:hypothetical protein
MFEKPTGPSTSSRFSLIYAAQLLQAALWFTSISSIMSSQPKRIFAFCCSFYLYIIDYRNSATPPFYHHDKQKQPAVGIFK